jgi:DNA-directed RNA polymerase specialized sigma24 family protein
VAKRTPWKDLTNLYGPLILRWLNRQGVPARDLDDLSQDIVLSVVQHLPSFQHSGNPGAFRRWLRSIVCSRTIDYWRAADPGRQATGGSGATAALHEIEDPDSALNRQWEEEHDRTSSTVCWIWWRRSLSRARCNPSGA